MSQAAPYRTATLTIVATHQESAFCPWCRHAVGIVGECWAPGTRKPHGERPSRRETNEAGRCPAYAPSTLTRLVRLAGLRNPVLTEVVP